MNGFAKTQAPVPDALVTPVLVPADDLSLRLLFRLAAAAALIAAVLSLTGCGGGGGGSDAPVPPPPPPVPAPSPAPTAPIAAQLSVPTPAGYDADRLAAFNRLNEIRLAAGLGMLAQNMEMDQAAQAHAAWMIENDSFTHEEQENTTGFTGINWARRDEAFGYVPSSGAEVMVADTDTSTAIDVLANSVYHRSAMLAFEPVDVGIGWSGQAASTFSKPLVIDLTRPGTDTTRGLGQAAQDSIHGVEIWPVDGAHDVPLSLGLESPNPVPSQDVLSLGTPASVTVSENRTITAVSFDMTNDATGVPVPVQILTNKNDSNFLVPESFIAAIPLQVLASKVTYTVTFSGAALDRVSGVSETIDRTWSFTTASQ